MSALDDLTVAITTYRRPERLRRCLDSVKAAGVTNVVVCDGEEYGPDIGCNNTWLVAAYRATTKRIVVLHDDDSLAPEFGAAYAEVIGPALDRREAGFVSWNAAHRYDDGTVMPCPYWEGPSTLMPSHHLLRVVDHRERFSLSPVVSVLNRATVIHACKEAGDTLKTNASLYRDGMLLGTEILVYLRHIEKFRRWLYLDRVLSFYGIHEGSGTVEAEQNHKSPVLVNGYNLARDQGRGKAPPPRTRIIVVFASYPFADIEDLRRRANARFSWRWHFQTGDMIECPVKQEGATPLRLHDFLDRGCAMALPEDIVLYANVDGGSTSQAYELILDGIARGRGVTCCPNRKITPEPGRIYKDVTFGRYPGGIEFVAMTPQWWALHREKMPNMYVGREGWDTVFSALAEEWADGKPPSLITSSDDRLSSRSHTDNVCWHEEHLSDWQQNRMSPTQQENRAMAVAFFAPRGNKAAEWFK